MGDTGVQKGIQKYFWDVNLSTVSPDSHKRYIIERLLDMGDEEAISWLRQTYSKEDLLTVAKESRRLSRKSKKFWALVAEQL